MHYEISKERSLILKALSLFLMVAAHVCWNDTTGVVSLGIGNTTVAFILYQLGKNCVYIFALLSGYGLYHSLQKEENKIFKNRFVLSLKRILAFLCGWWLILFTVFLPLFIISGSWDLKQFIFGLFGYGIMNHFAWYAYFYLFILATLPFADLFLKKNKFIPYFTILFLYVSYFFINKAGLNNVVFTAIKYGITLYTPVLLGYSFAKEKYLTKISNVFLNKNLIVILTSTILFIVLFKFYSVDEERLYMPFLALFFVITFNFLFSYNVPKFIKKPLEFIGEISMYIWLLHGVAFTKYCNNVLNFSWFFYLPKEALAIILFIIISFIPLSMFYLYVHKKITRLIYKK